MLFNELLASAVSASNRSNTCISAGVEWLSSCWDMAERKSSLIIWHQFNILDFSGVEYSTNIYSAGPQSLLHTNRNLEGQRAQQLLSSDFVNSFEERKEARIKGIRSKEYLIMTSIKSRPVVYTHNCFYQLLVWLYKLLCRSIRETFRKDNQHCDTHNKW